MLDDLRRSATGEGYDDDELVIDDDIEVSGERRFLGMTAVERMFVSILLFLVVLVVGLALLLATGRIQL